MKWESMLDVASDVESHPARGAWIEIPRQRDTLQALPSHPARGAWIEI